jgi:putative transposase
MRENRIVTKYKKKFRLMTNSNHSYSIVENLLQRQLDVSRPGEYWVSDITYVPAMEESFESVCDSIPWRADRPFD